MTFIDPDSEGALEAWYLPSILARRLWSIVHLGQISARSMTSCTANNEERCEKYPDEIAHALAGSPDLQQGQPGAELHRNRDRTKIQAVHSLRPDRSAGRCALVPRGQKHLFVPRHKLRDDCGWALAQDRLARGIRTVLRAHL